MQRLRSILSSVAAVTVAALASSASAAAITTGAPVASTPSSPGNGLSGSISYNENSDGGGTPGNGTFSATTLNYNGSDTSAPVPFLNSNGGTDGNTLTPVPAAGSLLATADLEMDGFISLPEGTTNISLNHDDGASVTIDGQSVISAGCCGTDMGSVTVPAGDAGLFPIAIHYQNVWFQGGVGGANLNLSINNAHVDVAASPLYTAVPEPTSLAFIAFGGTAFLARRRRAL